MKRLFMLFALSLFFAILIKPAYAGGGLIDFAVSPAGIIQPNQYFLVTANVYTDKLGGNGCNACKTTFRFIDNVNGDSGKIIPFSDSTDEKGHITAKVISATEAVRHLQAVATFPDGHAYESSWLTLNFQYAQVTPSIDPVTPTSVEISRASGITITSQHLVESVKGRMRQVSLKWDGPVGMYDYYVFFNPHAENNGWAGSGESTTYPYATIPYMLADEANDIKVQTCPKGSTEGCVDSEIILLGAYDERHPESLNQTKELDSRLASLEAKVKQTEKKQGFLESQLAGIVSFLKRIFPFWK